jgi:hypothetical protein
MEALSARLTKRHLRLAFADAQKTALIALPARLRRLAARSPDTGPRRRRLVPSP